MSKAFIAKWFVCLCCLFGDEDIDYFTPETDPEWWDVYLHLQRN